MAIITLTTDFGWADYYVGAVKGIIYQICPQATVVDVTHEVPPFDVLAGALVLREIWRTFPPKTIHVAVVDPGVGSDRPILMAKYANHFFLVPDNGILTLIHHLCRPEQVNMVTNAGLFCQPVWPTFHARDIFAPVAAHLAKGLNPDQVGPRTDVLRLLDLPEPAPDEQGHLKGRVLHVDRFGNLVTNLSGDLIARTFGRGKNIAVTVNEMPVGPVRRTFADAEPQAPVAYIGSAGLLEIGINQGRAEEVFRAGPHTTVRVEEAKSQ